MAEVGERAGSRSPSKRWATTATCAMEEVSRSMFGNPHERVDRMEDLRNRKIANTRTSIRFGNDSVMELGFFFALDFYVTVFFRLNISAIHKKTNARSFWVRIRKNEPRNELRSKK
jgi:hypothetical protein